MTLYVLSSLKRLNFHLKSFNPITSCKFINCGILDVERKWNETKEVPKYFNFFQDVIKFWALKEKNSERVGPPALWYVDKNNNSTKWTYQELVERTEKASNVLKQCGLERNDRMLVILPKIPEWLLIQLASFQLGIVSSPGSIQLRGKDIRHRINFIQAKCVVTDFETSERIDEIAKDCPTLTTKILCSENKTKKGWLDFKKLFENSSRWEECARTAMNDPMIIYFTSGSTGEPKAVQHFHDNSFTGCVARQFCTELRPDRLMWNLANPGWVKTTFGSIFFPWSAGSGTFIDCHLRFDPKICLSILQDYPITNFCAPPTAYKLMIKAELEKYKFPHLKHCASGGESLTKELFIIWKEKTGMSIYETYGQTETSGISTDHHCTEKKPGSAGLPLPGLSQIAIVNEKCEEVEPFQEGEIAVKIKPNYPVGFFKEYMNNPEKTKEVFKKDYYLTGDRGYVDNDGYLWFVGRSDDIINSAGYRIGPYEIESALQEHPAVKECAVIGSPDPLRGEVVKAFIILTEKYEQVNKENLMKELQDHAKSITSPYKYPRKIEFVRDFPRTLTGKVQKFKLREQEREANKNH